MEVKDAIFESVKREDKVQIVEIADKGLPRFFFREDTQCPGEYLEFPVKYYYTYAPGEKKKGKAEENPIKAALDEATMRERLERLAAKNIKYECACMMVFGGCVPLLVVITVLAPNIFTGIFVLMIVFPAYISTSDYFKLKKEYSSYTQTGTIYKESAKCTGLRVLNGNFLLDIQGETMKTEAKTSKEIYLSSAVGQEAYIIAFGLGDKARCAYLIDANGQYIELR